MGSRCSRPIDRRSLLLQLGLVGAGVAAFTIPSALGYAGTPEGRPAEVASVVVAVALLITYLAVIGLNLRRHSQTERSPAHPDAAICRRCITQAADALERDPDWTWKRG